MRSETACWFFENLKGNFFGDGNFSKSSNPEKEKMIEAQKEILERRRNPAKRREYEEKIERRRQALAEEKDVYTFQNKKEDGYDPLVDWKRLKDEGKIKMSKDLERDVSSSRLGSEGLIDVRVDERMPYIDQGYVDEESDVMGKIFNIFKKKEDKKKM